jgi:hypothetical protein
MNSHTRVVVRTEDRRGKSLIPASRIAIEESKSESDERSEATEAEREAADDAIDIVCPFIKNKVMDVEIESS